jgi:hypothetical protein
MRHNYMSGPARAKAEQKRNALAMDSPVREPLPLVPRSGIHADVLALHQAVGNRAFNAAIRRDAKGLSTTIRHVLTSDGQPLGGSERAFMEERFGTDFGDVRIHADTNAASSAEAMSAKAYTVGSHIVFGAGQYVPGTHEGNRLLAHELAHVIQQSRSRSDASSADSETEASNSARAAVAGQSVSVQTAGSGIQCDTDEEARRKQRAYQNFINLPKDLQGDLQRWGVTPPEKPPVMWVGGTRPSPTLQAFAERVGRKADEEKISIKAAVRKVQQEGPKAPLKTWPADPTEARHELNRRIMAIGGKPAQDPNRKFTEWEKAEIQGAAGGKRNPRNWRTVYNPDTGDIVGYERESGGYYERRNTKGEVTHRRESPMTEDETYLTTPDRNLTPFEQRRVFIEKEGRRNPERYRPIYNKNTGELVGYTHTSLGITRTYNTKGDLIHEAELGLEPSALQLDDLLGIAAVGKAVGKKVLGKAGQWVVGKTGEEVVEQGGKRILTGAGKETIEKVGEGEIKQAGKESVEELGQGGLKNVTAAGGKEAAELGGELSIETGAKQVGKLPAPFSPAPAEVGEAAFKARMTRDVENVMRANLRNTIGSGGEAAAQSTARATSADLNAIKTNFPQLDTVSRETVASVKAFGVGKPPSASVIRRYDKELRALRSVEEPGVLTKLGDAADLMAANRGAIQGAGAWPKGLARNATPEQIAKFINRQGVLAIPADHVGLVRSAVAAKARANPALYGLTEGPGLEKGIERLMSRVQSLGLTSDEIMAINKKVFSNP